MRFKATISLYLSPHSRATDTTIQEFGGWMKGRFPMKGNKDWRIPKNCCDGEENVDC